MKQSKEQHTSSINKSTIPCRKLIWAEFTFPPINLWSMPAYQSKKDLKNANS